MALLAASGAAALSLGNPQGSVVLGRPLDLVFDVRTDGPEIADACVTARIVAGEVPVSQSQVSVTPVASTAGRPASVRVRTAQPVNEPVVSVRLAAGCSGSVVRTYTVLAYPPEALDIPQAAATRDIAAVAPLTAAAPRGAAALPGAGSRGENRSRAAEVSARPRTVERPVRAPRLAPSLAAPKLPADAGRPRLVMEPLSDWLQAPAMLRASNEMSPVAESASPSLREEAAARWRALNMQPEELLQEDARRAAQDKALAEQSANAEREKAAALSLQQQLQERAAQRFPAFIVYALAALLLALIAALLWLWARLRGQQRAEENSWTKVVTQDASASAAANARATVKSSPVGGEHDVLTRQEPAEPEMLPSGMMPLEFGAANGPAEPSDEPAASAPANAVVNPEDLFDLQQQAEFFVSVGEHDQAIEVMKKHIEANQGTSPSAYLELLRLYRSLSRIEQFNELRAQFHRFFNAHVPEFAAFARPGKTLFSYPDVLARIEALWCDPSVVPLLQEMLFRGPEQDQRFDLPAYDDLLLLHAVARTTPAATRGQPAERTRTTPWDAAAVDGHGSGSAGVAEAPAAASNLMEFEPDWDFDAQAAAASAPAGAAVPQPMEIDLDLSDLTHLDALDDNGELSQPLPFISQQNVPAVPGTPPPTPSQPVGFGANNERFEARVDPDEDKPDSKPR